MAPTSGFEMCFAIGSQHPQKHVSNPESVNKITPILYLWLILFRPDMKMKWPHMSFGEMSKLLSSQWSEMSEDVRAPYSNTFSIAMEEWKMRVSLQRCWFYGMVCGGVCGVWWWCVLCVVVVCLCGVWWVGVKAMSTSVLTNRGTTVCAAQYAAWSHNHQKLEGTFGFSPKTGKVLLLLETGKEERFGMTSTTGQDFLVHVTPAKGDGTTDKPKRGQPAYFLFGQKQRPRLKQQDPYSKSQV